MADAKDRSYAVRARLPRVVQFAALGLLGVTVLGILVGFYRERNKGVFQLKPEHTQLSTDVVAEVTNYERLETDGDVKKYYVKADHAKTFSDDHQELDHVYIEVYGANGSVDKLSGDNALYVPEPDRNFTAYLKGNVNIQTRDDLTVKTTNIVYTKKDETAVADELVRFQRQNVSGTSTGAKVFVAEKRIDLQHDVNVEMTSGDGGPSGIIDAQFKGDTASFDQNANRLDVNGNIQAHLQSTSGDRSTAIKADRAIAMLAAGNGSSQPTLSSVELTDNVWIETTQNGDRQATIETAYALYDKNADRFEMKNGVHMVTGNDPPADIRAAEAVYEQASGDVHLSGNAELTKGTTYVRGDNVDASLNAAKKIKTATVKGSGYLKSASPERSTELWADQMNAAFDDAQQVQKADATGNTKAVVTPTDNAQYTQLTLTSPGSLHANFHAGGLPSAMSGDGRATIQLNVPNGSNDAANKRVTADNVNVAFNDNGKDIKRAEAVGNAELYIEPLRAAADNYRTTINAPRFDCDFYPTGNNARRCVGQLHTQTVRQPTVAAANRGKQTIVADKLTADFSEQSKDIQTLQASGNAKFSEADRNATAGSFTFSQADQVVRLRGDEPTFWDSSVRAKAPEIDWDTRGQHSYLRGGVSTTYYTQNKTGNAAPFGNSDRPVFATAQTTEIDHRAQTATFSGNARAWQDNNYVRADRFTIDQQRGTFAAEGSVQSLLYDAKQKRKGDSKSVPVFAAANALAFSRDNRILQYRGSVDIRQGTDRLTSQIADVYLDDHNQMSKTIIENGVTLTQPGRKAIGDWAEYAADSDMAVIRGNPARVEDAENGSSESGQITVYLRDNRVYSAGASKQNPSARTRSVYKVKN